MSVLTDADWANFRKEFKRVEDNLLTEIQSLKNELSTVKSDYNKLKVEYLKQVEVNQQLSVQHDDLEQYGRRYAIRVEGLEYTEKEDNKDLQKKLIDEFKELEIEITDSDIVRLHRSSKLKHLKIDRNSSQIYPAKQCLIKFSNWRAREKFQSFNRKMKSKTHLRVYNDLTKRRHDLLSDARSKIREGFRRMGYSEDRISQLNDSENIFAMVDINSNLVVRCRGEIRRFNNNAELNEIINTAFPRPASVWGDREDVERDFGSSIMPPNFIQQGDDRPSRFSLTEEQQAAVSVAATSSATGRVTRASSQR